MRSLLIAGFIAVATGTARADIVTDWNQTAIEVMKVARVAGNPWSRALAMMHVAMSDAINSVQGRYTRYVATVPGTERARWVSRSTSITWQPSSSTVARTGLMLSCPSQLWNRCLMLLRRTSGATARVAYST